PGLVDRVHCERRPGLASGPEEDVPRVAQAGQRERYPFHAEQEDRGQPSWPEEDAHEIAGIDREAETYGGRPQSGDAVGQDEGAALVLDVVLDPAERREECLREEGGDSDGL